MRNPKFQHIEIWDKRSKLSWKTLNLKQDFRQILTWLKFLVSNVFLYAHLLWWDILWYTNVQLSVHPFHMLRSNLRTPWPIHFKLRIVIGIDSLMVCILFGEISVFHSRVMGLYSSNCRRFFVCRAVNWEPLLQFTSNFVLLLELIVFTDFSKNVSYV